MKIVIRRKAMRTLESIAEYVEELNTAGAGDRWLDRFFNRISSLVQPNIQYPLCGGRQLAERGYSCIHYKNWVIAFKIQKSKFVIFEVIHGSLLRSISV